MKKIMQQPFVMLLSVAAICFSLGVAIHAYVTAPMSVEKVMPDTSSTQRVYMRTTLMPSYDNVYYAFTDEEIPELMEWLDWTLVSRKTKFNQAQWQLEQPYALYIETDKGITELLFNGGELTVDGKHTYIIEDGKVMQYMSYRVPEL